MNLTRTRSSQIRHAYGTGYRVRPPGAAVQALVIETTHHTGDQTDAAFVTALLARRDAGAHYVIAPDGLVDELLAPAAYAVAWEAPPAGVAPDTAVRVLLLVAEGAARTDEQNAALTELVQQLLADFALDVDQVVLANSDDAGLAQWRAGLAPGLSSPLEWRLTLLGAPRATAAQVWAALRPRTACGYTERELRDIILEAYFVQAEPVGIDPVVAICQSAHETQFWDAFWARRPQRNPAGIGVTGEAWLRRPNSEAHVQLNHQRGRWERGLSFRGWVEESIPAHLGRLLAFALPRGAETTAQRALVDRALRMRALPSAARGSAPLVAMLGRVDNPVGIGWADPGAG